MRDAAPMERTYYVARTRRLLFAFDRFAGRARGHLVDLYGDEQAGAVLARARLEFVRLIPELPFIGGGRNIFTWVVVVNGWLVALRRSMLAAGKSARDTIKVAVRVSDDVFRRIPAPLLRLIGKLAFSPFVIRVLRRQAKRSQERQYPQDFVYELHEGGADDWALEFSECAVNKFYEAQGTEELKPYCNFFDVTYSRLMGMGVDARETIGLGCTTCRLRYKHGRETVVPEPLRGVLPES
jgi:hypothetical protein